MDAQSPNSRSHRINQPALPNACKIQVEQKAKTNAFAKHIGSSRMGLERKTANAEKRKGKAVTHSRPTIDTGAESALRIKAERELRVCKETRVPHIKPENQANARK